MTRQEFIDNWNHLMDERGFTVIVNQKTFPKHYRINDDLRINTMLFIKRFIVRDNNEIIFEYIGDNDNEDIRYEKMYDELVIFVELILPKYVSR